MLGYGFDSDPQFPWAREILTDESVFEETERIDRLHAKAWEYFEFAAQDFGSVEGDFDSSRFVEQIRQLRQQPTDVLPRQALPEFQNRLTSHLKKNFPRKCEYLGDANLSRTIERSTETARIYNITSERGTSLFGVLAFILGSGFDTDPRLPWISAILKDKELADQNEKVNRLFTETVDYLRRWWAFNR
jgi:hypothetical protein